MLCVCWRTEKPQNPDQQDLVLRTDLFCGVELDRSYCPDDSRSIGNLSFIVLSRGSETA